MRQAFDQVLTLRRADGRELRVRLVPGAIARQSWKGPTFAGDRPLLLRNPRQPHWATAMPEHGAVYAQYNLVRDGASTVAEFAETVEALLAESGAEKLIIDVRNNTGGDNTLNTPLLHAVLKNESINRPGHMFVLISPRTYSAAMDLCSWLERETHALFVGARTGGGPNHCGEPEVYPLPGTGVSLRLSEYVWYNGDPRDNRRWIEPHVTAKTTIDDLVLGRDPALEAALSFDDTDIIEAMERTPFRHHWWSEFQRPALDGWASWPPR